MTGGTNGQDPVTGGTGGEEPATGGSGNQTPADPEAATHISDCIDSLLWGQNNIQDRDKLIDVIIKTCQEFAPSTGDWQTVCQMFLVAAANKESSLNASASSGGSDPTVGLTQIRYSSTVTDFASVGPVDALQRIGCDFPSSLSGSAAAHMDMMTDVACNIALGAWYYFIFGSGSGGGSPVWVSQYCSGGGAAGSLKLGMLCHLCGAESATGGTCNGGDYLSDITSWFENPACYGSPSGTHPFDVTLEPSTDRYCN